VDSFAQNLTALDAAMAVAAIAALIAALVSSAVLGILGVTRERTLRTGLIVFAAGIEIVSCLVAPLAAYGSVHATALQFGAENMQSLFAMPAIRAIAILGVALTAANLAAIASLVRPRE
jgi:hypothetical protein